MKLELDSHQMNSDPSALESQLSIISQKSLQSWSGRTNSRERQQPLTQTHGFTQTLRMSGGLFTIRETSDQSQTRSAARQQLHTSSQSHKEPSSQTGENKEACSRGSGPHRALVSTSWSLDHVKRRKTLRLESEAEFSNRSWNSPDKCH
ncbi:unnamed protein product [Pleuronectes platessa]|uniref:Uncharacterized protein n=1 Tax=Pleuronectes platessa TaxID=8262 RepID=A0A9N7W4W4_PLEPL|nr:unnamed protein product [Pleuronectes platessa]